MLTDRTNSTNTETLTYQFFLFNAGSNEVSELIYCETATSVPSENLFSNAGLVQNDQRNRMEPSTLKMASSYI
ncbi:hypothetical protein BpHYR1_022578 [Brachionus plicatilis]|uniref:HAT C-terminal dimerisation domain-containing protein n=1 Tax=Brachionus plicatilis TaxID=10195 RepID=A0A3M7RXP0_BRAPC|nr:hypothetical protein BpHYR1_022578 [Brachionus plicatilis]